MDCVGLPSAICWSSIFSRMRDWLLLSYFISLFCFAYFDIASHMLVWILTLWLIIHSCQEKIKKNHLPNPPLNLILLLWPVMASVPSFFFLLWAIYALTSLSNDAGGVVQDPTDLERSAWRNQVSWISSIL